MDSGAIESNTIQSDEGSGQSAPPPRRFVGRRTAEKLSSSGAASLSGQTADGAIVPKEAGPAKRIVRQQVPDEILHNEKLQRAVSVLPSNYNFEIHKTIWRIKQAGAKHVALQFPEGLLMYSCVISDILEAFADVEHCYILGDVTYGACCVDDYSARALGCDFLVHYGHSCLVPVDVTAMPCMYVFVDIAVDLEHFIETVRINFPESETRLVLAGTIQFSSSLSQARDRLSTVYPSLKVPQCKPLSPGEVLGCTAPVLTEPADVILFLADGRFHLESLMIANPEIPAYRYDPYGRVFTRERYDHVGMRDVRRRMIERARGARRWAVVLGTLGRQGNPHILEAVQRALEARGLPFSVYLMSEISPQKIAAFQEIEAWVQIACPRLSIDWGEGFSLPVLTPYEGLIALGAVQPFWEGEGYRENGAHAYPQDYYDKSGGEWSSSWLRSKGPAAGVGAAKA